MPIVLASNSGYGWTLLATPNFVQQ